MLTRLKKYWASLRNGQAGSRFQEQYEKERKKQKSTAGRVLRIIAGALLIPVGLFFLAVPGPGLVIIALGALLIAREFLFAATVLDWMEVRGRRVFTWAKQRWHRLVRARRAATR